MDTGVTGLGATTARRNTRLVGGAASLHRQEGLLEATDESPGLRAERGLLLVVKGLLLVVIGLLLMSGRGHTVGPGQSPQ